MDAETFEEVVAEERSTRYAVERNFHETPVEKKFEYEPYVECPRCSNWKLAAHVHEKRHKVSKGFLRGSSYEWRVVERWWECKECAGTFDVPSPEAVAADEADDAGADADEEIDDADAADAEEAADAGDDEPRSYELELTNESWSKAPIPVDGGEKGIILDAGIVTVPTVDAEFKLPRDAELPEGTELWIGRNGDEVYCIEEGELR